MSEQIKKPEDGIDLENVTFDGEGKVEGLSDETLEDISGGLMMEPGNNNGCGNNVSC